MSVGRPDPYAYNTFSPEQYNRNRAVIESAQAQVDEFAKMNEIGKVNFELLEKEERELNQRILDGQLAEQQKQQLLQRKALALSYQGISSTSRIEEAGSGNARSPQENVSMQQNFASYPPPVSQLMRQPTSASYTEGSSHPNQAPQHNQIPPRTYPSQYNNYNATQYQYSTQTPVYPQPAQMQAPVYRGSFSSQQPSNVSQAQAPAPQPQQQSYSSQHYRPLYDPPNSSTSSLVGALGPNGSTNPPVASSSRVAHQNSGPPLTSAPLAAVPPQPSEERRILIPNDPTALEVQVVKQGLDKWASGVRPQTKLEGIIQWRNHQVKCFKNQAGAINFFIETPEGPKSAHWFMTSLAEAAASRSRTNRTTAATGGQVAPDSHGSRLTVQDPTLHVQNLATATTPTTSAPIIRDSVPTNGTHPPANQTGAAAASSSIARNTANTQTAILPVTRTTQQLVAQTPVAPSLSVERNVANPQTILPPIARTPAASSSSSVTNNIANPQAISSFVSTLSSAARTIAVPSPYAVPAIAKQQTISSPAVSIPARPVVQVPAAFSSPGKAVLTPAKQSITEGSTGPILTPQQADKKRIAQSLLWALGKRPREGSSDADSQSSKRHASSAAVQAQVASNNAQTLPEPSQTNGRPSSSNITGSSSSQIHASSPNLSQNPAQPSNVGVAPIASAVIKPPTSSQQPSQSYTQPVPSNSASSAPRTQFIQYNPGVVLNLGNSQSGPSQNNPYSFGTRIVPYSAPDSLSANLGSTQTGHNAPQILPIPTMPPPVPTPAPTSTARYSIISQSNSSATSLTAEEGSTLSSKITTGSKSALASASIAIPAASTDAQSSSSLTMNVAASQKPRTHTFIELPAPKQSAPSSKHVSHNEEPLFLPSSSPESDPSFSRMQSETPDSNDIKAKKDTRRKGNRAYVLVPSAPEYLVRHREQLHRKRAASIRSGKLQETASSVSVPASIVDEEEFWYALESQRDSDPSDENEREAIRLSCSRLQASPCRWDGCNAIMNSGEALIRHLNLHKPEPSQNTRTYMCRWTQCGQQGVRFEDSQHLKKHALLPLRCAYMDCKDSFRSGGQLLKHFRRKHAEGTLKPSAKPEAPTTEGALPDIPAPFPSYLLSTNLARGKVLSKERHLLISKQVLMNITFCDDGAPLKRRSKKTARPASRNALPDPTADLTNDYQFLTTKNSARSSTYFSKACDIDHADLDSAEISRMVEQGIVFWGSEDEADDGGPAGGLAAAPDSPLFSPVQLQRASHAEIKLEAGGTGAGPSYGRSASVGRQIRHDEVLNSDVEHAAVETMLTDMTLTQH